jgi:hypothetical protein
MRLFILSAENLNKIEQNTIAWNEIDRKEIDQEEIDRKEKICGLYDTFSQREFLNRKPLSAENDKAFENALRDGCLRGTTIYYEKLHPKNTVTIFGGTAIVIKTESQVPSP